MGRPKNHGKNVARRIDLDILTYGSEQIHVPGLEVPHARIGERLFVLLPLQEIAPDFVLPGTEMGLQGLIDAAAPMVISRR
jgi:2-amino-4-hydroxy-6-hydroxymethyldihydropteridine diphosphokinase